MYDGAAASDMPKTDAPHLCKNGLHSLFPECTVSANGLKISNANENYAQKFSIETDFSHKQIAKKRG